MNEHKYLQSGLKMIDEALFPKKGNLHDAMRQRISEKYGIDPNHKDWAKVGNNYCDLVKYAQSVFDHFCVEIKNHYMENDPDPDHGGRDWQGSAAEEEMSKEALEDLVEFVRESIAP